MRRALVVLAGSAGLYWVAGRLALLMAIPPGYATAVWPAAGLALVCVLRWGIWAAPGVALGSLLVNVGTSFDGTSFHAAARSLGIAATLGTGAALQATVGAWAIAKRLGSRTELEAPRDIAWFVIVGGPVACTISATVGVTALTAAGLVETREIGFNWGTWWTGDTIGVVLFAPLAMLVVSRTEVWKRRRRATVAAPLLLGFVIVTVLFVRVSAWERARSVADFQRRATAIEAILGGQIARYEQMTSSLASYFEASQTVQANEFRTFCARALREHPGLLAVSWNPIVAADERAAFEAEAGFRIKERHGADFIDAAPRDELVPIRFIEPEARNASALGFDIASEPVRRAAVERARRENRPVATEPVVLVQSADGSAGVLIVSPVMRGKRGFAVAAFTVRDIVDSALVMVDHDAMSIEVHDAASPALTLYAKSPQDASSELSRRVALAFVDRTWMLSLGPTREFLAQQRGWQAWAVLAFGLSFVGLLGVVLLLTTGQASRLEALNLSVAASEAKYRGLYEESPDMYLTATMPDGTIIDVNQTLCEKLGYTRDELLGRPFHVVYHAEDVEPAEGRNAELQTSGDFVDVERRLRTKAGGLIEVSLNLRAVRDVEGNVVGARAVWRDITRRKRAEADQRVLVEVGDILRSSTQVDEVLSPVADLLRRHLGVETCGFVEDARRIEAPLGEVVADLARRGRRESVVVVADRETERPAEPGAAARAYLAVLLVRDELRSTHLVAASRAPRVWSEREVELAKLVGERVWSWVERMRVLTSLRERAVQDAIRQSEERFRTFVQGVKDYAIFMLDPTGKVTTWNPGAAALTGYADEQVLGRSHEIFYVPEDRARARENLASARADGRFAREVEHVRLDGSRFWVDLSITPMFDAAGELEGFANLAHDITSRRQQDEALRRSLRERTVLLQEVHHRVKNNLQVIASLISMQVRRLDPGPTRDAIQEAQSRVFAIALIHEKLYQSHDYAEVPFAEYTSSLVQNVLHATGMTMRNISVQVEIDDILMPMDRAIPCGLIINELMTNALKHAFPARASGLVTVRLVAVADRVQLTVADDGIGLAADFDIHTTRSMGLQLVATLAEQLHAQLVIRRDGGTTYEIGFGRRGR